MEYPFVGKLQDAIKLFYSASSFHVLQSGNGLNRHASNYKNITRECLEGKCVKIESTEHSEFVQKLAFNAGYLWLGKDDAVYKNNDIHVLIFKSKYLIWDAKEDFDAGSYKQITIPLPSKAEPKERPQVGDEVAASHECGQILQGELLAITNEYAIIQQVGHEQHLYLSSWRLSKPKTEAEILRDELISAMDNSTTAFVYAENIAKHLISKGWKKPQ